MIQIRHINRITKLDNAQGQMILDHNGIEEELVNFYHDILSDPCLDKFSSIAKIMQHIPSLIIEEKNVALLHPIT